MLPSRRRLHFSTRGPVPKPILLSERATEIYDDRMRWGLAKYIAKNDGAEYIPIYRQFDSSWREEHACLLEKKKRHEKLMDYREVIDREINFLNYELVPSISEASSSQSVRLPGFLYDRIHSPGGQENWGTSTEEKTSNSSQGPPKQLEVIEEEEPRLPEDAREYEASRLMEP